LTSGRFFSTIQRVLERTFRMNPLKEAALETIRRLPDECSLEDIMYRINFIAQVLDGLRDAEQSRTISTEELLARVEQWAK